jgi:hypothetical protein
VARSCDGDFLGGNGDLGKFGEGGEGVRGQDHRILRIECDGGMMIRRRYYTLLNDAMQPMAKGGIGGILFKRQFLHSAESSAALRR